MSHASIFDRLPPEMIKAIADQVDPCDVLPFKLACKTFNACRTDLLPTLMRREYSHDPMRSTVLAHYFLETTLADHHDGTKFVCSRTGHLQDRTFFADRDMWQIVDPVSGLCGDRICLPCQAKGRYALGVVEVQGLKKSICHMCYIMLALEDRVTFDPEECWEVYGPWSRRGDCCTGCADKERLKCWPMHYQPGYICQLIG